MARYRYVWALAFTSLLVLSGPTAQAQTFGVEAHNTLMPASGGMAGASIARPQDLTSAINGNPASITQFTGTQFLFGGAWAEPTFNLNQTAPIPFIGPPQIDPFSAKSTAPGAPMGNIGVTQELSTYGLPATLGIGFISATGSVSASPGGSAAARVGSSARTLNSAES